VSKAGATTIPVRRLFGIVRELPSPEVDLEADDKNICALRSGASFYKIHGIAADEYPPLPQFKESHKTVLPAEKIKTLLRRTSYAISTDETRYVLNGIFLSLKADKVTMVATDGRRLALAEVEADSQSSGEFIVPTKAVNELNRILSGTGDVEIKFTENQASFSLQDEQNTPILLITKLVEGNYPNYKQVIPSESKERITLMREELLHAVRRAEFMTSDKANSVKLTFSRNNLTITANTPEVGEGRESIAINYQGKEFAIAFNPVYLLDPLKALETDEVVFELTDELSPGVIRINEPFLYVLMPMRMS
jgi:DNA polymerase-3 subunit beta